MALHRVGRPMDSAAAALPAAGEVASRAEHLETTTSKPIFLRAMR
jgi:hypothetical protein